MRSEYQIRISSPSNASQTKRSPSGLSAFMKKSSFLTHEKSTSQESISFDDEQLRKINKRLARRLRKKQEEPQTPTAIEKTPREPVKMISIEKVINEKKLKLLKNERRPEEFTPFTYVKRPSSAFVMKSPRVMPARASVVARSASREKKKKKFVPTNNCSTPREETDVFVKEIEKIEKLNKQRTSPKRPHSSIILKPDHQRPKSGIRPFSSRASSAIPLPRDSSPTFSKWNGTKTNHSFHSLPSLDTDTDEFKSQEDETEKRGKPVHQEVVSQEPLRLMYDPHQVRMIEKGFSFKKIASLRDYKMMAAACNRAGKPRMEALAYYKLGCMYEELFQPHAALKYYQKFLQLSQGLQDSVGTALALNCLGVCCHLIGGEYLKKSLQYHMEHWEIADIQGKIIAHINMGLVFSQMGDIENAAENHRMALQYASDIQDEHGESIALANLGVLGKGIGDLQTAQACIERHLLLSEYMKDPECQSDAYHQLGLLAMKKKDYETAVTMLKKAREIALENGDQTKSNQIKCTLGVATGNLLLDQHIQNIRDSLQSSHKLPAVK